MRTARNPSKMFFVGPCGRLKALQKYSRRGRGRRHRCFEQNRAKLYSTVKLGFLFISANLG